jgi:hypothetical protein
MAKISLGRVVPEVVTTSKDGLMSKDDKRKLDMISIPIKVEAAGNAANMNGYALECYRINKLVICNGYVNSKTVITNATLLSRLPAAESEVWFPVSSVAGHGMGKIETRGKHAIFNLPAAGKDFSFNFSYITSED